MFDMRIGLLFNAVQSLAQKMGAFAGAGDDADFGIKAVHWGAIIKRNVKRTMKNSISYELVWN